jgi:hypothetical protein
MARGFVACLMVIAWLAIVTSDPAESTIHTGTGYAELDTAWDFSDSSACPLFTGYCGDLSVAITRVGMTTASRFLLLRGIPFSAKIAFGPADSTYEELTTAPDDTGQYDWVEDFFLDTVYIVLTNDGHYAKIRTLGVTIQSKVIFEYTYQDDGTRILVDKVSIEATTWGRIKALYR